MAIEFLPRAQALDRYMSYRDRYFRNLVSKESPERAYRREGEPISSLYVNRLTCNPVGITDASDPVIAAAVCEVTDIEWTPISKEILGMLTDYGVPYEDVFRGGTGLYHNQANKRDANMREFYRYLVDDRYATALYQPGYLDNWWEEEGRPLLVNGIIGPSNDRTLYNLDQIIADPDLAVGEKPEDTGTGLKEPLNTRGNLRDHVVAYSEALHAGLSEYCPEIEALADVWPGSGGYIYTPDLFAGMIGAHRSDPKATWFTAQKVVLKAMSREVGTDFTSPFHNQTLNPRSYQYNWWQQVTDTSVHWLPQQPEGYLAVFGAKNVALPGPADEIVHWPVDFGYTPNYSYFSGNRLIIPKEQVKFGADQLSLSGIVLQSSLNRQIAMVKSGVPWTMIHYVAMIGDAIRHVVKRESLHVRLLQVGDDIHLVGPRDEMELIGIELAPWLRSKGILVKEGKWVISFFLGHYKMEMWES